MKFSGVFIVRRKVHLKLIKIALYSNEGSRNSTEEGYRFWKVMHLTTNRWLSYKDYCSGGKNIFIKVRQKELQKNRTHWHLRFLWISACLYLLFNNILVKTWNVEPGALPHTCNSRLGEEEAERPQALSLFKLLS